MSWNRPSDAPQPQPKKSAPSLKRGLLAGLVVVLLLLATVAFLLVPSGDVESAESVDASRPQITHEEFLKKIEKRTGHPVSGPVAAPAKDEDAPWGYYTNKLGQVKKRTRPPLVVNRNQEPSVFSNAAEDQLAAVVAVPRGTLVIDEDVPPDFEEDFKASLTNKIVISDSDSPDVRAQKEAVIEAKNTLAYYYKQGADIAEIVRTEKRALAKLYEKQQQLEEAVCDLRDSGATTEEIAEMATAARELMRRDQIEVGLMLMPDEEALVKHFEETLHPNQNEPATEDFTNGRN